jgi:streptomycin 6-kinase
VLAVPESVVQMQLAANGEAGRAWLTELPRLIDELRELWSIAEIGPAFEGGCVAYVAPVVRADGSRVVLKVCLADEETECEADGLAVWKGNGAVRLLESDQRRGAMLLERLEPGTPLAAHPDHDLAIAIACSLLRRLWVPAPPAHRFRLVTQLARQYAEKFPAKYAEAARPFSESLLDRAVDLCHQLAQGAAAGTIANRDFHLGNILAARREPWLVIDPKPLVGEPAFDAAHLIRSLLPDQIAKPEFERLASTIATRLDLPAQRIASWVFVRSIENALWAINTGVGDFRWDVACAEAVAQSFHLL